jgi:hypothetical protein
MILEITDNGKPVVDPTADQARVVALMQPLAEAVWECLNEQGADAVNSIGGARAALLAMEQIGLPHGGFGLAVSAEAMNARMGLILEQKGRLPVSPKEAERWFTNTGAHSVVLAGKATTQTKHSKTMNLNHMVVCFQVGDRWYMMDPTIAQASRPEKKLTLRPLVAPVTERFVKGKEHGGLMRDDDGEGRKVLRYLPRPSDDAFLLTPDWAQMDKNGDLVKRIVIRYADKSRAAREG